MKGRPQRAAMIRHIGGSYIEQVNPAGRAMQVLVTGGTGFIGRALVPALRDAGHTVIVLSREARPDEKACRYVTSLAALEAGESIGAVINLAGASLAARRWTRAYKQEIAESRLQTTREVLSLIARLNRAPDVLLNASAIGFYGHSEGVTLMETAAPVSTGFAQQLCADWERLALEAEAHKVRVCLMRIGVVLDRDGGALVQMAQSFRFGVASWLGNGRQWLSWVHREDVVNAMCHLLRRTDLSGPVNLTAPEPVTGRAFCNALRVHFRTLIAAGVPAPVMRLMVGEMADEILLDGQKVIPHVLLNAGFEFRYPDLRSALEAIYTV